MNNYDPTEALDSLSIDRSRDQLQDTGINRKKRLVAALFLTVTFLSLSAFFYFSGNQVAADVPKPDGVALQADAIEPDLKSSNVNPDSLKEPIALAGGEPIAPKHRPGVLSASGYVVARRKSTVSSKIAGLITNVYVEEGMLIKKGALIAELDSSRAKIELEHALQSVEANNALVQETEWQYKQAKLDMSRSENLVNKNLISRADFDLSNTKTKSIESTLKYRKTNLELSEVDVKLYRDLLDSYKIYAPFEGVVIEKNAQPGEIISPSSAGGGFTRTGLCTLIDMKSLELEVDVNESYVGRIFDGQEVSVTMDAYPSMEIPAKVIAIVPTANRSKATIKVRIGFENLDEKIMPDMGVSVVFYENKSIASSLTNYNQNVQPER